VNGSIYRINGSESSLSGVKKTILPKKRVIALGFFDGMHLGHSALMKKTREIGKDKNLIPSVATFDTHPLNILENREVPLINSSEDRMWLMQNVDEIEETLILHFDKKTALITWEEFIDYLVEEFGARYFVAGEDYTFGKDGVGNVKLLKQKCAQMGIGCDILPVVKYNDNIVSSTAIREMLRSGEQKKANAMLGHPHILSDIVRYGFRLGRKLGTPTINMLFQEGVLVPAHGVYATKVYIETQGRTGDGSLSCLREQDREPSPVLPYIGITNVGARPTVDDSGKITAETHILNFQGNLYGRKVRIEFHEYLRPEIKFAGLDELKAQIQKDCATAEAFFN